MARTRIPFEDQWTFHLGDNIARPRKILAKAHTANGLSDLAVDECEKFNIEPLVGKRGAQAIQQPQEKAEGLWKEVKLHHDWRISMPPSPSHSKVNDYPNAWQGFFPVDISWYRKVFDMHTVSEGRHVSITFDGIVGLSDFWFNGMWLGSHATGYSPVTLEVTDLLRADRPNVLLVRSDITEAEGWWYEGGGIYRHVWLDMYGSIHVPHDGIHVFTTHLEDDVAEIGVEVEVANNSYVAATVDVLVELENLNGETLSEYSVKTRSPVHLAGDELTTVNLTTKIKYPVRWNLGDGKCYTAKVSFLGKGQNEVLDKTTCTFGIRTIEFNQSGILVNGRHTKIFGANIHQDFGVYGVALPDRVVEAKLEMLAEMGVNAIRSSHHPHTPELVEHADRLGMLVLVETRLLTSARLDLLKDLIRRSRSHPSVFMYSLGNEEIYTEGTASGRAVIQRMHSLCKLMDPSRPTTYGGISHLEDRMHRIPDVMGMHYRCLLNDVDTAVTIAPHKSHVLDEEGLYASVRGVYNYDRAAPYSGSLSSIFEALLHREEPHEGGALALTETKPSGDISRNLTQAFAHENLSGAFVWTGLDYRGEPTPRLWPAVISSYGAKDIVGIPKNYYWLLRSIFRPDQAVVHAFPHWSWPGRQEAQERIPFRVYTNCDEVEFFVNDTLVGPRMIVKDHKVDAPDGGLQYIPGNLLVRGYRNGVLAATHKQFTAGEPSTIRLIPDRQTLSSLDRDVCIVRIAVVDARGTVVPGDSDRVSLSLAGPGFIAGAHNGNPNFDAANFNAVDSIAMFDGQAAVILESLQGEEGVVRLCVAGPDGVSPAELDIVVSNSMAGHQGHRALDERDVGVEHSTLLRSSL
ncbi:hypothetical protein PRZ48_014516 [Zasmidium cellare]|uniref:Beta-galactosidase n=1 Tax=Zasmidium cellare TaxID=395010 RepID=A0ABR0DZ70_ZASCE|nr:hypothetical protein PRZ48_014516 [Zasmidium cellare]